MTVERFHVDGIVDLRLPVLARELQLESEKYWSRILASGLGLGPLCI